MIKRLPFALVALASGLLPAMEPAPGSVSPNQTFAVRQGAVLADSSLDAFEGKILVVMMMTPWCPICQGNAIAVGDGVLDHYFDPARGPLRGKTDQGIEIATLLLSTETSSGWDSTNSSFAAAHGFQQWGLDATAARTNPRVLLGYYRGGFINSSNLYDWGNDRRRITVLNLVKNSPSHPHRAILFNQNHYDSSFDLPARNSLDAVAPAPSTVTFAQWSATQGLTVANSGPQDDPDGDGTPNLLEFFHGSSALSPGLPPRLSLSLNGNSSTISYPRAKGTAGITVEHQISTDLISWTTHTLPEPTLTDLGETDMVTHAFPSGNPASYFRLRVSVP